MIPEADTRCMWLEPEPPESTDARCPRCGILARALQCANPDGPTVRLLEARRTVIAGRNVEAFLPLVEAERERTEHAQAGREEQAARRHVEEAADTGRALEALRENARTERARREQIVHDIRTGKV